MKTAPPDDVTLAIYDSAGRLVRQLSSADEPLLNEPPPNVPLYWVGHPRPLSKNAGMNRIAWDLRYPSPQALRHDYAISALPENTPPDPRGPLVPPGRYEVRLIASGKTYRQPLEVATDPRAHVSPAEMAQQAELAEKAATSMAVAFQAYHQIADLRIALADHQKFLEKDAQSKDTLDIAKAFDQKALRIEGETARGLGGGGGAAGARPRPTFASLNANLGSLVTIIDAADGAPTEGMKKAVEDYSKDLDGLNAQWAELRSKDLPAFNGQLIARNLAPLAVPVAPAVAAVPAQNAKGQNKHPK